VCVRAYACVTKRKTKWTHALL